MSSADNKNSTNNPLGNSPSSGLYEHPQHYIKDFDNAEDHYRDLIENASDIIYRTDLEGNFVYVNPVAARIMEYPVEELLQMNYLDLVTPEYREETGQFYQNQLSEGIETTYFEFETETKTGKKVWFGQNVRIIKRNDKWIGFQALARDITDRHTAQQKLKNNEEQLRLFVKHAPVAVAMFNTEMEYIMASDRWVKQYDIDHDDISGLSHYELFPELSDEWKDNFSVGLSGVTQSTPEERIVDKDGEIKWIKWEIHPWRRADGEVGGIIVYTEDITKRKEDEIALVKAREEAQQASSAKSSFIASMSHEFRTPLNAVMGFAEILEEEASLTKDQKELLKQIHESGSHLLAMINDVIEISRIETSRIDYEEVDFEIESLLHNSAKPFLNKFADKGLEFTAKIASDVPKYVATDMEILDQMLRQLISNALKFTDAGKVTIDVNYEGLDPDAIGRNGLLKLEVIDTGIGFDKNEAERILRPFSKLNDQGYSGTGLGLTVVKRLCRFLDGELKVSSEPGQGSVFKLIVPVQKLNRGDIDVEEIDFINQRKADHNEVLATDVGEFIKSLPSQKQKSIVEALELQKLDQLIDIVKSMDLKSYKDAGIRLITAAEQYNFAFLKEVLENVKG